MEDMMLRACVVALCCITVVATAENYADGTQRGGGIDGAGGLTAMRARLLAIILPPIADDPNNTTLRVASAASERSGRRRKR